jgi:hypothetical protein
MPRYFFDVFNDEPLIRDEVGFELADLRAVRDTAIQVLPKIASEELSDRGSWELVLKVRDVSGQQVFEAKLALTSHWLDSDDEMPDSPSKHGK